MNNWSKPGFSKLIFFQLWFFLLYYNVYLSGWFVVWKMFLIRFSFIWELVYGGSNGNVSNTSGNVPCSSLRRSLRMRDMGSRKFWTKRLWHSAILVPDWIPHPLDRTVYPCLKTPMTISSRAEHINSASHVNGTRNSVIAMRCGYVLNNRHLGCKKWSHQNSVHFSYLCLMIVAS